MGRLIVKDRSGVRQMPLRRLVTIGRSQNSDLVLDSLYASRRHAWVWQQGDRFIIEDLGSRHGTFIQGRRITAPRFLNEGDVILMGDATLTFSTGEGPISDQMPPHGFAWPMAGLAYCSSCGAANDPGARFCARCGDSLSAMTRFEGEVDRDHVRTARPVQTSRPITPTEPIVARPFPTVTSKKPVAGKKSQGAGKGVRLLILLLAILALSLITVVGLLVVYVLS